MLILGQVRLGKGSLCPAGLEKRLRKCPLGLEIGKVPLKLIFNNLISSILFIKSMPYPPNKTCNY